MSNLTVSSKTTPYSTGGTNGTSSSTTVSRSSSSTTISNKVSSTTPNTTGVTASTTTVTKTTGAVTSSTTTAYGASNTNSVVRFISSSTTVSKNVSSTTPSVSNSNPIVLDTVKYVEEDILDTSEAKLLISRSELKAFIENAKLLKGHENINQEDIDFGYFVNLIDGPTTEIVDDVFSGINNEISQQVIDNVKNFLSNDIKYTEKFNVFNIEMGTMLASFRYYGDIEVSGGGTDANLEVENLIRESMNEFFNIKELAVSFGNKEASFDFDESGVWCVLKDDDEELKLNLTKLSAGRCNMAYERSYTLEENEKGAVSWVIGMEMDIDLTKNISADLKESYEYSKEAWVRETVTSHIEKYENEGSWYNGNRTYDEVSGKLMKAIGSAVVGTALVCLSFFIPSISSLIK